MNIEPIKKQLEILIARDGFNVDDFEFGYLTQEEYDNKLDSKVEIECEFKGGKKDG